MDFIAKILAELDTSQAESQLKTLTKDQTVNLKVQLTGDTDVTKILSKLDSSFASAGQDAGKSYSKGIQAGLKSYKFNGNDFLERYIAQQKKDIKESETVAKKYQTTNQIALKAVRARNTEEIKLQNQQQKELDAIENARLKSIENSRKHEEKLTLNQNKAINKSLDATYQQQQKDLERQKAQLKSYTDTFNNGKYSANSKTMSANLEKYNGQNTDSLEKARNYLKEYQDTYKEIQNHFDTTSTINFKDDELVQKFDKLETAASKYKNMMREVSTESSKTLSANAGIIKSNEILTYYNNNTKAIKKYGAELRQLTEDAKKVTTQGEMDVINEKFKKLKSTISAEGLTGKSWTDDAKRAFGQIAQFTGMYGILQNVMQDVPRAMVQNVIKIDDAMTNLRMATSVSNDEAQKLMKTYSEMGKELKVLGTDIATSSTEWLKQGKSIQESDKLTRDSIILSKIGDLSSEDATKTITAAMKSYDLAESQVMGFIDQISSIDMASATDVGGLSQAFNEVAANAKNAGIETEKLLSYAAVIGETSQEGMASVGTSLNAIFSRMGNIKLSRLKDYENDGEDLSNVETVLKKNGIALRDATGQFKEFDDVLDETASKWKNFDSVTQRAVANAFAGTHHANNFMILMEQYDQAKKYMDIASTSSGESIEKFTAYQESLSGSIEGFKNAAQSLSNTTLDSSFLKDIVNTGTGAIEVLDWLIDKFGILQTLIGGFAIGKGITSFVKSFDKPACRAS